LETEGMDEEKDGDTVSLITKRWGCENVYLQVDITGDDREVRVKGNGSGVVPRGFPLPNAS